MRLTFIFILSISSLISFGYNQEDSLRVAQLRSEAKLRIKENNLSECILKLKEAISLAKEITLSDEYINKELVSVLANRYSNIGDFERAIELNLVLKDFYLKSEDYTRYIWTLNNLGIYYNNQGKYKEAKRYFQDGYRFANKLNLKSDQIDLLDGLVHTNISLGEFANAKRSLNNEKRLLSISNDEFKDIQTVYYNYAQATYFDKINQKDEAIKAYKKAIHTAKKIGDRKLVSAAIELANLYLTTNKYKLATEQIAEVFEFYDITSNPLIKDPYLLQAYFINAQALRGMGERQKALLMIHKAEEQATFFHSQYMFTESKFFLDEYRRKNLELGVTLCNQLWEQTNDSKYVIQALLMADNAKSNVLKERVITARMLSGASINEDDKVLRFQLVYQLNELKSSGNKEELIRVRNRLDSLNTIIGVHKTDDEFNLDAFQKQLSEEQLVVEYFFADSLCYQFSISRQSVAIHNLGVLTISEIAKFYSLVSVGTSDIEEFSEVGSRLYNRLIKSVLDENVKINKLIIIPDKSLNYLPFGAIITTMDKKTWSDLGYLEKSYAISYGFSLQSLAQQSKVKMSYGYLGFAPDFSSTSELAYLKNGEEVLSQAKEILGGRIFLNEDATAENLIAHGLRSKVMQLYTHAVSSDSSYNASYIYMQDRKIFVDEIMSLPLQTDLCLLTACEVGLGKNYNGEGVTSVAWAFRVAGAQNVVQSMWKLNEQSSSQLMGDFFTNMSQGQNSSKALSNAKKMYLEDNTISARLKHPFYWAGISHFGKGTSGKSSKSSSSWIGILALLIGTLVYLGIRVIARRQAGRAKEV
ncbi:MAG: hypothetical protein COA58_09910 [Bacteroidetes bacterium]|nr:MAG: hypothetical protein COA58_09910 [Bacteroidota bacterium]